MSGMTKFCAWIRSLSPLRTPFPSPLGEGAAKRRMRGTRRQPRQTDSSLAATRPPLTLILSPVGERRCLGLRG